MYISVWSKAGIFLTDPFVKSLSRYDNEMCYLNKVLYLVVYTHHYQKYIFDLKITKKA